MIKVGTKNLKIKNADGTWESFVASGITVDGEINKSSNNAVANSAVAEALDDKIGSANIATNAEIDNIFEKEGN